MQGNHFVLYAGQGAARCVPPGLRPHLLGALEIGGDSGEFGQEILANVSSKPRRCGFQNGGGRSSTVIIREQPRGGERLFHGVPQDR